MTRLRAQQLDQRITTAEGAFRRLGHIDIARQQGSRKTVVLTVSHPGWGAPAGANLRFVETWGSDGDLWHLIRYAYDLVLAPGPGRYGFHWHDGTHHTHCVDPRHPERDHHFDGSPIDLFDAFERFSSLLNGAEVLSCAGLNRIR